LYNIIVLGFISFKAFIKGEGGVSMSYGNYGGPPWGTIAAKKKLKEMEDLFKDWRTRLVKIGERVLREIEKGNVSEEVRKEFREFIEKTKAVGIYGE
jgi:hypothetical protein